MEAVESVEGMKSVEVEPRSKLRGGSAGKKKTRRDNEGGGGSGGVGGGGGGGGAGGVRGEPGYENASGDGSNKRHRNSQQDIVEVEKKYFTFPSDESQNVYLVDFCLIGKDGQHVPVHKLRLAEASSVFAKLFAKDLKTIGEISKTGSESKCSCETCLFQPLLKDSTHEKEINIVKCCTTPFTQKTILLAMNLMQEKPFPSTQRLESDFDLNTITEIAEFFAYYQCNKQIQQLRNYWQIKKNHSEILKRIWQSKQIHLMPTVFPIDSS